MSPSFLVVGLGCADPPVAPTAPGTLTNLMPASVVADGRSVVTVSLRTSGVADGTLLELSSTLGAVRSVGPVLEGRLVVEVTAGTWPGVAELRAPGVASTATVSFVEGDPVDLQLHLHGTISEGNATMADHTSDAEVTGTDVLWWTDHDGGYLHPDFAFPGIDFEGGLVVEVATLFGDGSQTVGFRHDPVTDEPDPTRLVEGAGRDGTTGWRLGEAPSRHVFGDTGAAWPHPLLAGLTLGFWVLPPADGSLVLTVPLSTRDSDGFSALEGGDSLVYAWAPDGVVPADARPIAAAPEVWTQVRLDLSADAAALPRGPDQHLDPFAIEAEGGAFVIDGFTLVATTTWHDLVEAQRVYLDGLGGPVRPFVGFEISGFGSTHLNAFGSAVPLLEYATQDLDDAVDHVHASGGLVSFNHMFGTTTALADAADRAEAVVDVLEDLDRRDVYGVDLLEVGYRERTGELADFLTVWDGLAMRGHVVTGIGSSDQHDRVSAAGAKNNFVTWVRVPTVAEEDLLWALRRGAAWFGDPTRVDASFTLSFRSPTARAVMGQVVAGGPANHALELDLDPLPEAWTVRRIEDGVRTSEEGVGPGPVHLTASIRVDPPTVVRYEVYDDPDAPPILLTNPITFVAIGTPVAPERSPAPRRGRPLRASADRRRSGEDVHAPTRRGRAHLACHRVCRGRRPRPP